LKKRSDLVAESLKKKREGEETMRKIILPFALIACITIAPIARVEDAPPSEESIRELMNILDWKKVHEGFLQGLATSSVKTFRRS
jgi:hypothetical protein